MSLREALLIGLGAGLLFGVLAAFLLEFLDDSIRTRQDLLNVAGGALPVLGVIPVSRSSRAEVVSLADPYSPAAEAYRSLRTAVHFAASDRKQCVAVTTARSRQGKTETVVNLALLRGPDGQRVVVVDCDMRSPRVHDFFGVPNDTGFTSVVYGAPLSETLKRVPGSDNLYVLPTGPIPGNPAALLASQRCYEVLASLQADDTLVLIDTPPVLLATDAAQLAPGRRWGAARGEPLGSAAGSSCVERSRSSVRSTRRCSARCSTAPTAPRPAGSARRRAVAIVVGASPAGGSRLHCAGGGAARPTGRDRTAAGDLPGRDGLTSSTRCSRVATPSVHSARVPAGAIRSVGRLVVVWAALSLVVVSVIALVEAPAGAHTPHDTIADVALSPAGRDDHTAYAISRTLLLKTTDGGATWAKLSRGVDPKGALVALGISQQDPGTVYTAGYGGSPVYRSQDAGSHWTNVSGNIEGRSIASLAVSPVDDQLVFAAGRRDHRCGSRRPVAVVGGRSERSNRRRRSRLRPMSTGWCSSVTRLAPSTSPTIVARRGPRCCSTPVRVARTRSIVISPEFSKDRTFFVGTESAGVYRTTDGGSSFTPVDDGLSDRKAMSLALSPSFATDDTLWVSTYTDGVYESSDRGKSWSARLDGLTTDEQADLLHRKASSPTCAVAAGRGGSTPPVPLRLQRAVRHRRRRAGVERVADPAGRDRDGHRGPRQPTRRTTLFLTTYINGLFRSENDGKNWPGDQLGCGVALRPGTCSCIYVNRLFPIAVSPDYAEDHTVFAVGRGDTSAPKTPVRIGRRSSRRGRW